MPSIASGHFAGIGTPQVPRSGVAPVVMRDGRVLVAGGCCQLQPLPGAPNWDRASGTMKSAEIFDPATGSFTFTGELVFPGNYGTATLLPSGRVLVVLGWTVLDGSPAQIYDPTTGTFSLAGELSRDWSAESAVLLRDGQVLLIGHTLSDNVARAELYDEATNRFENLGQIDGQVRFGVSGTLLEDGRVLVAGGGDGIMGSTWSSALLYEPSTKRFTPTGSMTTPRAGHSATLLPDGRVLIVGGLKGNGFMIAETHLRTAELYDPKTGQFTSTSSSTRLGGLMSATLLLDGRVLVLGPESDEPSKLADIFDPAAGRFLKTGSLAVARWYASMVTLLDGRVLITSGENPYLDEKPDWEIYFP